MKKTAIITGGSKGLGFEIAKQFGAHGYDLILLARHKNELEDSAQTISNLYSNNVDIIPADLSHIDSLKCINETIKQLNLHPEVLVNNAGLGMSGLFHSLDYEKQISLINVNITALTGLSRLLLPSMIEKKRGGILNVSSTAGFFPGPLMCVYYASKAYVLNFSQALREEVKQFGITVSTLCPGPTKTHFEETSGFKDSNLVKRKLLSVMPTEKVASAGYRGFQAKKRIIIPGLLNRLVVLQSAIFPSFITGKFTKYLNSTT